MLEDIYLEYLVKKKKTGGQIALIAFIIALAAALTLLLGLLIFAVGVGMGKAGTDMGQIVSFMGLLLIVLLWYGAYLLITMQNIEYEYILTNNEMDIDKVMSKKGRKPVISFDFKEITVCANINDNEHNGDYKNIKADKTVDATGDKNGSNIYFADFIKDGGERVRVLFSPTSKMINSAKRFNPRSIFVMDE
jgi:hypothetical protein